jgi:hypothetical protein
VAFCGKLAALPHRTGERSKPHLSECVLIFLKVELKDSDPKLDLVPSRVSWPDLRRNAGDLGTIDRKPADIVAHQIELKDVSTARERW